jgi:hypothetical protein
MIIVTAQGEYQITTSEGIIRHFPVGSVLIVQLIQFADPDALALVGSFGKAVYAAPGRPRVSGSSMPERAGPLPLDASRS